MLRSGEPVVFRDVRGGRLRAVSAALVVEDTPERLVTWIPLGSPLVLPADASGELVKTEDFDHLVEVAWQGYGGPLFIWPRGQLYSVRLAWDGVGPERSMDHWYVNLHTPLAPSRFGFDMEDLILDVVIPADRQSWMWKDELAFEEAVGAGAIDEATAEAARQAGHQAVELARDGAGPFGEDWPPWSPKPGWRLPTLPDGCIDWPRS